MFPKNHPTILRVVPSYFKLNPDKEEKIIDMLFLFAQVIK